MSHDPLNLFLSDDVLARIRAAAAIAGLTPEAWAAEALKAALEGPGVREDGTPFDAASRGDDLIARQTPQARAYQHAAAREALEEYDRTGVHIPLEDVLSEVRADLEARLAAKA